jgi:hypothetical protein
MEPTNKGGKKTEKSKLPNRLASLCAEENASLTRPLGDGTVIPRQVDPNEKPRTAGARTAG